ncbi:MAG: S8 family serine peptidase [Bacteroidota bacterium]
MINFKSEQFGFKKYPSQEGLIAVKKKTRLSASSSKKFSVKEKREYINSDAQSSLKVEDLKFAGFEEVPIHEKKFSTNDIIKDKPIYNRMGHIGAYILYPNKKRDLDHAIEILANDYDIIPNIMAYMPPTVKTEIRGDRRNQEITFPKESAIELARNQGISGLGVMVGVLDTGCDADHWQFRDQHIHYRYVNPLDPRHLRKVRGFDTDGHGTHVCGIIAGADYGVAPDVEMCVASVIESETSRTALERIVTGLDWFTKHISSQENSEKPAILNLSLGFLDFYLSPSEKQLLNTVIGQLLDTLLYDLDVLPVVAIGNEGPGISRSPGNFPSVLSVGSVSDKLQPSSFSGGGTLNGRTVPDLVGFGDEIYSSLERSPQNRSIYAEKSGTSMATPYVTGIAALVAQKYGISGLDLKNHLLRNTLNLAYPQDRVGQGLARYK